MCAIAGIFYPELPKPIDPARLRAMAEVQAHRGPDGAGVWSAPGIGLAHRRLAIIDLGGGAQPMLSEDGALALSFNGEIYNFQDVRAELQARGAVFRTASDSEVLLHGWAAWGPALLDRLNGMFAFALYDARTQSLMLARDRLGVKPLHYAMLADGALIFASELKGLLAHPLLRRTPDPAAIEDFMALGYVPDDACLVAGVKKLAAGHYLLAARGKPVPAPQQWWDVDFSRRTRARPRDIEAELIERMREAVRLRMIADVPLGAFLSGGVDSSAVVALMAEASRRAVKTCTIGFDEAGHDERSYATRIAERFATEHRSRTVSAADFALVDTLVAAFDEPFADASALATYRVCELARETVTVALSGDGADEAFAGYRRYRFHAAEERVRGLLPAGWRAPLFGTLGALYPKADWAPQMFRAKSTFEALARDGDEAYALSVGVTGPAMRASLFSDMLKRDLQAHRAEDRYIAAMRAAPARDPLDRAQYADLKIWLPGDILTKVDRTSMAVSLEAREPLLDHRLVEFGARLPVSMRLRHGEGKWLMKRALRGTLPDEILYRKKMGFVSPIVSWFRGPLLGEAERVAARLNATGWFAPGVLDTIVRTHASGISDHGRLLWQLVMFEKSMTRLFGQ